ncbi:MAG TPA: hypothetical protein VFA65_10135 [Bryobacteraceae bacterium]|nr:hypothetical protein [Bryobacteraceae bacterium]
MDGRRREIEAATLIPFPIAENQFLALLRGEPTSLPNWLPSTRILKLFDSGDRGKTSLLKRLKHRCQFPSPGVPVALIDLKDSVIKDSEAFCQKIHDELSIHESFRLDNNGGGRGGNQKRNDDSLRQFPEKRGIEKRLGPKQRSPVRSSKGLMAANIGAADSTFKNSPIFGQIQLQHGSVNIYQPDLSERAQRNNAQRSEFLRLVTEKLRAAASRASVVVLIDHWDDGNIEVREWAIDVLVGSIALCPNLRLFVVIAGKQWPPSFAHICENWQQYVSTMPTIEQTWGPDQMRDCLVLHGCEEFSGSMDLLRFLVTTLLPQKHNGILRLTDWLKDTRQQLPKAV